MVKTVKLLASLRQAAGVKEIHIELDAGATVRDLLSAIRQTNAPLSEKMLDADDALLPGIQVLVDGRHIDFLHGPDTLLDHAENIMLMPPIFGG